MKKLNRSKINPPLNKSQDQGKIKSILTQSNTPASSTLISTMKMELSNIKQDVEKLMNDEVDPEAELELHKGVNHDLKQQINFLRK